MTVSSFEEPQVAAICCAEVIRIYRTRNGRYPALKGINLEIAHGEKVAVAGASGSGKSAFSSLGQA